MLGLASTADIWAAITAIATAVLTIGVAVSAFAYLQQRRVERHDPIRDACRAFVRSQHFLIEAAREARRSGGALGWPHPYISEFESAFRELEIVASPRLAKAARELWNVSRGYINGDTTEANVETTRQAFLTEARSSTGAGQLDYTPL